MQQRKLRTGNGHFLRLRQRHGNGRRRLAGKGWRPGTRGAFPADGTGGNTGLRNFIQ